MITIVTAIIVAEDVVAVVTAFVFFGEVEGPDTAVTTYMGYRTRLTHSQYLVPGR